MDATREPNRSRPAARAVLAAALIGLTACAATREPPEPPRGTALEAPIRDLAERLVDEAELRADLSRVLAGVHEIREARPPSSPALEEPAAPDAIGLELAGELELALAGRLRVVDSGPARSGRRAEKPGDWQEIAARLGVTHLLLGEYTRGAVDLVLTVRLVEAESRLIVSAARGRVPLDSLGAVRAELELERLTKASPEGQIPPLPPERSAGHLAVGEDAAPPSLPAAEPPAEKAPLVRLVRPSRYPLGPPAANPEDFETWRARVGDLLGRREKSPAEPRPDPEPAVGPAALRLRALQARPRP